VTHRFFLDEDTLERAVLRGDQAHQIANVLRLRPGGRITVVRNGIESVIALETVDAHEVQGRVVERRPVEAEPGVRLTLAIPILRGERTEQVIAAVTQLGVGGIVPFVSARSVVRELTATKHERWRRIAREAAETSRRGRIPQIGELVGWEGLFDVLEPPILVAWEREPTRRLLDSVPEGGLTLVIGPEGGLAAAEVELARERGAVIVSLGRRNLRSETAAIAAVAQLMAAVER